MFVYKPEIKRKLPVTVCALSFALGAVLIILSILEIGWSLGEQVAALVMFVIGIEITTRYLMTEYTYKLGGDGDSPELAVIKRGGTREMAVCNIGFDTVVCVERRGKLRDFERKYGRMDARYNYCANMRPRDAAVIHFEFNGKKVLLTLEADDTFFSLLEERVPKGGGEG